MSKFISSRYAKIEPYVPGEQPRDRQYIKLNTNESPFPPSPRVMEALNAEAVGDLNLYSDPTVASFRTVAAEYHTAECSRYGVNKIFSCKNIFAGNGSDEVLAFIFQAFGEAGMAFPQIGYGFYPVFCGMLGIPYIETPVNDDLSVDTAALEGVDKNIAIANPNAQTGLYMPISAIKTLVAENENRLIVVDEAYCDFGGDSAAPLLAEYDNLIIVKTLSKSRQLAGARIGYAVASEEIITDLERLRYSFNPYNVNRLTMLAGAEALRDTAYFEYTRGKIIDERERVKRELRTMGARVTDSLANFVLAGFQGFSGSDIYRKLKSKGILVRFLDCPKLADYVRITIGSAEQNDALLGAVKNLIGDRR